MSTQTSPRTLKMSTLDDLRAETARIKEADAAGCAAATKGWTPAQTVWHVASFIRGSLDGCPFKMPLPMRLMGKGMRLMGLDRMLNRPIPPGFKIPPQASMFNPSADVTMDQACELMNTCLDRIDHGEKMTHPSPLLGKLTHEQWTKMHLRHAELHLSNIALATPQPVSA